MRGEALPAEALPAETLPAEALQAEALQAKALDVAALQEVRLRPHHLLCLQNFRGRGYSPEFVQRMTEISGRTGFLPFSERGKDESGEGSKSGESGKGEPRGNESGEVPAPGSLPVSFPAPAPIRLVRGCDDLCRSCPNYVDGRCGSDKPGLFDKLVLDHAGLAAGHVFTEGPASKGMPRMSPELLEVCCPDCEWLSLCREICARRR